MSPDAERIAALANRCCYRIDGYEEEIAQEVQKVIDRKDAEIARLEAMVVAAQRWWQ